jgi:hypothetical protein
MRIASVTALVVAGLLPALHPSRRIAVLSRLAAIVNQPLEQLGFGRLRDVLIETRLA